MEDKDALLLPGASQLNGSGGTNCDSAPFEAAVNRTAGSDGGT